MFHLALRQAEGFVGSLIRLMELNLDTAPDTLRNVCRIWGRPVHIESVIGGKGRVLSFDGSEHSEQEKSLESKDVDKVKESSD